MDRKSNDYAHYKDLENWKVSSFPHSIMTLHDILGLPFVFLFLMDMKNLLLLCAIFPRVIALRNKLA